MLYRIKNLIKSYEERVVLDLHNLSMEEGKIIGLLGPNGAGKTTLLEVMGFLLPPCSGEVWYKKERVDFNNSNIINLRQKVVLVQQQPILFTGSVFNNVEFPLKIRKKSKQERQEIVEELLSLVGMEDFRYAKAHKLSRGRDDERRRSSVCSGVIEMCPCSMAWMSVSAGALWSDFSRTSQ